jgi:hypothetical protein
MALRFVDTYGYDTKLVIPTLNWVIYGHPTNFNYFVTTPLVPAVDAGRVTMAGTKKTHSRRRYKGDPAPSTIKSHTFDYLKDPGRKVGSAIPGWSFILDDGTERRQFTTTGDVQNLVLYLQDNLKKTTKLYTQGASTVIDPAANGDG